MNTEIFIEKSKLIHGDKYDYSLIDYKTRRKNVKILFNNIIYEQTPDKHLLGRCPEKNTSRLTINQFIERSKIIHGNKYDYSLVNYINISKSVKIIYNGIIYNQTPDSHLQGLCPEKKYKNTYIFIQQAKLIHGDKYDYSLVNYVDCFTEVKIIYNGIIYEQAPSYHLTGRCPEKLTKINYNFIENSKKIHGDKYDYSLVNYKNNRTKVKIIHNGKIYEQNPSSHLKGINPDGSCPELKSIGEKKINEYLNLKNINYTPQHTFDNCKYVGKLIFDFYLSDNNILIEFDGIQHFESIEYFGGLTALNETIKKDNIKNLYAKNNNINLLRIKYTEMNNIISILENYITQNQDK